MSNGNGNGHEAKPDLGLVPKLQIVITFDPTTQALAVNGPQDLLIALGMIEMAKVSLTARLKPQEGPSSRIAFPGTPVPFVRR